MDAFRVFHDKIKKKKGRLFVLNVCFHECMDRMVNVSDPNLSTFVRPLPLYVDVCTVFGLLDVFIWYLLIKNNQNHGRFFQYEQEVKKRGKSEYRVSGSLDVFGVFLMPSVEKKTKQFLHDVYCVIKRTKLQRQVRLFCW